MSTITCPECGKELQVNDPSRSFIFCRHCGTKIAVDAFRSTHASCNSQDPIITPPPKSSWNPNEKSDASAEELRHQHELEMERLRYEHELELERLRHQNEMEREWMKHEYADAAEKAEPAEPADEAPSYDSSRKKGTHSSENKTLGWRIGHFCGKHPFWTIIIVLVVFQAIFGGSSTKTSSPVSSVSSSLLYFLDKSITTSASCSIEPDSRKSAMIGRWSGLDSTLRLSCESATTGIFNSLAIPFNDLEISAISCSRLG